MPINDNPPTGHTCPNCGHQWGYYAPMPDWDNPPPIPATPPLAHAGRARKSNA